MGSSLLPLFILVSLLNLHSSTANVTLSSSLTAGGNRDSVWDSPSGDFAFGFSQLNASSELFLLSIWFNKIPSRTVIWYANGESPAPKGSRVVLTATSLVLSDPGGKLVWQATTSPSSSISYAAMLDTGNFVLVSSGSSSFLWESFSNPTDTILPNQTLNSGAVLFSKLTESNYSRGRFALSFSNGSLDLLPVAYPLDDSDSKYYTSGTYSSNPSETGNRLVFNGSAQIYVVKENGDIAQLSSWDFVTYRQDFYYRATLDFDGVFTQYSHPKTSSSNGGNNLSWQPVQSVPDNICTAFFHPLGGGPCGYNSYCSISNLNSRPSCACPPGYLAADSSDRASGCRPTYPQGCGLGDHDNEGDVYEIRKLTGVNFFLNDYERLQIDNESLCEEACLSDCSCAVVVFDGVLCWKKRLPLSNGQTFTSNFVRLMFKVRKEDGHGDSPSRYPELGGGRRKHRVMLRTLLWSSVGFNGGIMVLLGLLFLVLMRNSDGEEGLNDFETSNLRSFSYKQLEEATDGFREELGRGSFGIVYKGGIGNDAVAVKKLDKLAQEREKEFKAEVNAIGRTHHKNLVRLLGFCDESSHRLLVYEFMANGTLASFLFGASPRLDWHHRVRISIGIARGLVYLHEECRVPIIHCDIKPQNVLLDGFLTAKVSDFGMAKLMMAQSHDRTKTVNIRGTRGYVAPEWFKADIGVTSKVDVYSFGVMLLEIICCRKSVETGMEESKVMLIDWAHECFVKRRVCDLLVVGGEEEDQLRLVEKWVLIALWCVQEDPEVRPGMKRVLEMLEGLVEVPSLLPFGSG
ncbi:G-type lectin S-receptor-like serine/threonine-protein kinase LECRK2 [Linum perenne]